jgi:hypothetical protein
VTFEGGCYCGKIRYVAAGEPRLRAQCHCRECQYISGGAPNMFMLVAPQGFRYTRGEPRKFSRSDLESPVTREFCGECGTHLATRRPGLPLIILKVGTLDDPSLFGAPQMAIYRRQAALPYCSRRLADIRAFASALTDGASDCPMHLQAAISCLIRGQSLSPSRPVSS